MIHSRSKVCRCSIVSQLLADNVGAAYETSSYLAVLFESNHQASSIFFHLVPELYLNVQESRDRCQITILISLLHNLVSAYPSQSLFRDRLHALPHHIFPQGTAAYLWLSSLSSSLRCRNYVKFEEVTRPTAFAQLLGKSLHKSDDVPTHSKYDPYLCDDAFHALVDKLRTVSRTMTWSVIRHAYRELSFRVELEGTRDWLTRSLALQSVLPGAKSHVPVEEWLEDKAAEGHVRQKEGVEHTYIISKVR